MKVTMSTADLKSVFDACKNFVSKTDTRPALQAVQLNFKAGCCTAYAADGIKLIQITVPCDKDSGEGSMLVPVIKLPKDPFVTLSDEGNEIALAFGDSKQVVKKYNDRFFENPERFFPTAEPDYTIYFDAKNLKAALGGFDGREVKFEFYGPLHACVVTQAPGCRALVFPVNPKNTKFR